jgi:hypothetical protein
MADIDPAHVLFPNDAPKASASPPDWYKVQQAGAEQRLMGERGGERGAVEHPPPSADAGDDTDLAAKLFGENSGASFEDVERAVMSELDTFTLNAMKDGDTERADALKIATTQLAEDFSDAGTPPEAIKEAFTLVQQSASLSPPTPEQREQSFAEGMAAIQAEGITDSDLNAARRFVADLERVSPGVVASLEAHGAGNSPKLIRAAIREARRRGY